MKENKYAYLQKRQTRLIDWLLHNKLVMNYKKQRTTKTSKPTSQEKQVIPATV
jgi:hypothetical protein